MKKKKDPLRRTKVVIRHLPPFLSQSNLFSHFDHLFSDRYNWFCFRPCKPSLKYPRYSRAYINFKSSEDVLEFAEFFHGHVFVNEKGAQFKAIVEYAPSRRVPKPSTKTDAREGTIFQDPEYLEFLKLIAEPVGSLPSAEIQLERKEVEESGAANETPISTPLMEFVRQKRAAKGEIQGSAAVKIRKRAGPASRTPGSSNSKQGSGKKHILKDSIKNSKQKDKSIVVVANRQEDRPISSSGKKISEVESISGDRDSVSKVSSSAVSGKKKIVLLKGKKHEIPASDGLLQKSSLTSTLRSSSVSTASKQHQRHEPSERLIRSILQSNKAHQNQSSAAVVPQKKFQNLDLENDEGPNQSKTMLVGLNGRVPYSESPAFSSNGDVKSSTDDKLVKKDCHGSGFYSKNRGKHTRNKDRPDQRVQTPLCQNHPGVQDASEEHLSSIAFQHTETRSDSLQVTHGEVKADMEFKDNTRASTRPITSGSYNSSLENGSHGNYGSRIAAHNRREGGSSKRKFSKKGSAAGYSTHEKQVWVQKSS